MDGRILLIEDEEHISRVLQLELQHEGYESGVALNGRIGAELAVSEPWTLFCWILCCPA